MTKKTFALSAVAGFGLALTAGVASADQHDPALDVVVDLGDFTTDGAGDPIEFTAMTEHEVVGFSFSGTAEELGGAWVDDTKLTFYADGAEHWAIGGFDDPGEGSWDFTSPGDVSHGPDFDLPDIDGPTNWTLAFDQDFGGEGDGVAWTDAQLTFHQIPAPGALALLGVAGLVGARRRRA